MTKHNSFTANSLPGFDRFCSGAVMEADAFGPGIGLTETNYFAGEEPVHLLSDRRCDVGLDVDTGNLWAVPAFGRGGWEKVTEVNTGDTQHAAFILSPTTRLPSMPVAMPTCPRPARPRRRP